MHSPLPPNTAAVLTFDGVERLRLLVVNSPIKFGSDSSQLVQSLELPFISDAAPENCLYTHWWSGSQPLYYSDKRSSYMWEERLKPTASVRTSIAWRISNRMPLSFDVTFSNTSGNTDGSVQSAFINFTNVPAPLDPSSDPTAPRVSSAGETAFVTMPNPAQLLCPAFQRVVRIKAGCPPGRHLRLADDPSLQDDFCDTFKPGNANAAVNLVGFPLHEGWQGQRTFAYDYPKWGCPIQVFFSAAGFTPKFELWDGDVFVETVNRDYVMFEIHGRRDYAFNQTADSLSAQSGNASLVCRSNPQTWKEMVAGKPLSENGWSEAWSSRNYWPCTVQNQRRPLTASSSDTYDILNSQIYNGIKFTKRGGIFIFKLTVFPQRPCESGSGASIVSTVLGSDCCQVVDPLYSECPLTVYLPIFVYAHRLCAALLLLCHLRVQCLPTLTIVCFGQQVW
jgi:hypothetical protein